MTSRLEPRLDSGSLLDFYSMQWGPIYAAVLSILGPTGTILPMGDPRHGQPNATTFKTVGAEQLTVTWSKAPSTFDTPLDLTLKSSFQGIIPFVSFDGVDEEADTPDADSFSRGDGSADGPLTTRVWFNAETIAGKVLWGKWGSGALNDREWLQWVDTNSFLNFTAVDESANASIGREFQTALPTGVWICAHCTYSGSAMNAGIKLYIDGLQVDDADAGNGSYTAMENLGAVVSLAHQSDGTGFYKGKMAGGPLGPCFAHKELSGDEVLRQYEFERRALAY